MRIVISGYYGFSNVGDDLILEASLKLLTEQFADLTISVVTYPRGDIGWIHQAFAITAVDGRDVAHVSTLIAAADLLLIGGGGLIQDYLPADRSDLLTPDHSNLVFWMSLAALASIHGVPAVGWHLGIGPLRTDQGRSDAASVLTLLDRVYVRDEHSEHQARSLNIDSLRIKRGADPVLALDLDRHRPQDPTISVVVRFWPDGGEWQPLVAQALDALDRRYRVVFVPFQVTERRLEDDATAAETVIACLTRDASIEGIGASPLEVAGILTRSTVVVSMRLHGNIVAAAAGIPSVGIAYDSKVTAQMAELGRAEFSLDLLDLDPGALTAAIEKAIETPAPRVDGMRTRLRESVEDLLDAPPLAVPTPVTVWESLFGGQALRLQRHRADIETAVSELELRVEHLETALAESERIKSAAQQEVRDLGAVYQEITGSRAFRVVAAVWRIKAAVGQVIARLKRS